MAYIIKDNIHIINSSAAKMPQLTILFPLLLEVLKKWWSVNLTYSLSAFRGKMDNECLFKSNTLYLFIEKQS